MVLEWETWSLKVEMEKSIQFLPLSSDSVLSPMWRTGDYTGILLPWEMWRKPGGGAWSAINALPLGPEPCELHSPSMAQGDSVCSLRAPEMCCQPWDPQGQRWGNSWGSPAPWALRGVTAGQGWAWLCGEKGMWLTAWCSILVLGWLLLRWCRCELEKERGQERVPPKGAAIFFTFHPTAVSLKRTLFVFLCVLTLLSWTFKSLWTEA